MAARMPSRWLRRVRASRTKGRSRLRVAQASQASRWAGARELRVGEVIEQAQFLAQQEGPVEALVDLADLVMRRRVVRPAMAHFSLPGVVHY